ncbi:MAG: SufD family Fe-S cluster assembly protein, partial [Gaiellaceae bacterium]
MDRAEALDRYRSLPLPDTSMEAWRFTDLRGFDPDSFGRNGHVEETQGTVTATVPRPEEAAMLDVDMAGLATAADGKIEIENAPAGVEFAPLPEDHERLGTLVGTDDKFSAHNAASWRSGLLVRVPKGMELDDPLYVRVTVDDDAASFWRLLVVAEEGSRFSLIEEYTSPSPEAAGYSNAAVELFVEQGAKLEYVSLQNLAKETWHFATHRATVGKDAELDWVAGGFGSRRGKVRIHNDLAGQGATSRVTGAYFADGTQHLDYDTFQQHHA